MATDAVIVLGAAVRPDGIASPSLKRRAVHGGRLVLHGNIPILIASGGVGRYPPSEASVIREIAVQEGVAHEKIILDEASTSTFESAVNCAKILRSMDAFSVIIVTDYYHLFRSVQLFRFLGFRASPSAPDLKNTVTSRLHWYRLYVRELLAFPWSFFHMMIYYWKKRKNL